MPRVLLYLDYRETCGSLKEKTKMSNRYMYCLSINNDNSHDLQKGKNLLYVYRTRKEAREAKEFYQTVGYKPVRIYQTKINFNLTR